jgi:hypothetical protein
MYVKLLLSLMLIGLSSKAQKPSVVIAASDQNILTEILENRLTVLIENTSSKAIYLTTDNGTIKRDETGCFIITPHHVGPATINVYKVRKKDTTKVGSQFFRVHRLPDPLVVINGKTGGKISKKELINAGGLIAKLTCCGFDAPLLIKEYSLLAITDSSLIGIKKNSGSRFTDRSFQILHQLKRGDKLLVTNLIVQFPSEKTRMLHSIEFMIDE